MKRNNLSPYNSHKSVTREAILKELKKNSEESYRKFSSRLIPSEEHLLGVRLPVLRIMAGQIAKGAWREYLEQAGNEYFEEIMLQGMVIGKLKVEWDEKKKWIEWFVPKINNWSVCDSFCVGLKVNYCEGVMEFLSPYLDSEKEYEVRFGLVMYLEKFCEPENFSFIWDKITFMKTNAYYAKMAAAWLISIFFREYPETVLPYLKKQSEMNPWIYKKSLQKILESRGVGEKEKEQIRQIQKKCILGKSESEVG